MIAVEMSDVDSIRALYACGADMNTPVGGLGRTALFSTLRLNLTADRPASPLSPPPQITLNAQRFAPFSSLLLLLRLGFAAGSLTPQSCHTVMII